MKKVANLQFYGFVELYQILKEKFPQHYFDTSTTESGYFQIRKDPAGETDSDFSILVLEVFNPLSDESNPFEFDSEIPQDEKITIGFFLTEVNTIRYRINKKDLDDDLIISELKNLIGYSAPPDYSLLKELWQEAVITWFDEFIKNSSIYSKLEKAE